MVVYGVTTQCWSDKPICWRTVLKTCSISTHQKTFEGTQLTKDYHQQQNLACHFFFFVIIVSQTLWRPWQRRTSKKHLTRPRVHLWHTNIFSLSSDGDTRVLNLTGTRRTAANDDIRLLIHSQINYINMFLFFYSTEFDVKFSRMIHHWGHIAVSLSLSRGEKNGHSGIKRITKDCVPKCF